MLTVEQALAKILDNINVLEAEERVALDCLGQVLAEDVYSTINVPPSDNAAMDGYAVRSEDTMGASPKAPSLLRVIDTVLAGSISQRRVEPGTAIRIMTGAPIPEGADSVVRFEDTDEDERRRATGQQFSPETGILRQAAPADNIRRAGEDVAKGALVLSKGTDIRPSEVGVLASLGRSNIKVIRRPVVAVLATGDELVEINKPLPPGKIYNSNSYSVAALVKRYGGIPEILGIASDNEELLAAKFRLGLNSDLLITTGGVSVGDYDIVKNTLAREGEVSFWQVRMKPGKPVAFGTVRGVGPAGAAKRLPHLGLPGNPVSVMVAFELFARPAILKMMGKKNLAKPVIEAIIQDTVRNNDQRRTFARVIVRQRDGQYFAQLTGSQGSAILTSMALANGLAIVPEDKPAVKPGDRVQVMMLDWSQDI